MKFALLLNFCCCTLFASCWQIDGQTKQAIIEQLEAANELWLQQRLTYTVDAEPYATNYSQHVCADCIKGAVGEELECSLEKAGFSRRAIYIEHTHHCYGVSLFFVEFLLKHPEIRSLSCAQILKAMAEDGAFAQRSHQLAFHQHSEFSFQDEAQPLELNQQAMKHFFSILIGHEPAEYEALLYSPSVDSYFDPAAIYTALDQLKNRLILIGYTSDENWSHCIAFYTDEQRFMVFDPNCGLFAYPNREVFSLKMGLMLQKYHFRWLAAFRDTA